MATAKTEIANLTQFLRIFTKDEKFQIQQADGRLGKRYAIVEKTDGSVNLKSGYMTFKEMECYMYGMRINLETFFK